MVFIPLRRSFVYPWRGRTYVITREGFQAREALDMTPVRDIKVGLDTLDR